jgi:hypothetical protein
MVARSSPLPQNWRTFTVALQIAGTPKGKPN